MLTASERWDVAAGDTVLTAGTVAVVGAARIDSDCVVQVFRAGLPVRGWR